MTNSSDLYVLAEQFNSNGSRKPMKKISES